MEIDACCIVEKMKNCREISTILPIDVIARKPLQPEFEAVVVDAIESVSVALGSLLNSLFLYGSVVRGCAMPQKSDLDLTVILMRQASDQERILLEELRLDLEARHSEVVKVDFDIGVLADVLNPANSYSWGYWLKHECRCIYGDDLSRHFEAFMPSRKIAEAVNDGYGETLNDYASRISSAVDPITARRLQKEAARKLVRSTNVLRPTIYPFWPRTLDDYFFDFSKWYPSLAQELEFFLIQATEPDTSPTQFNARLSHFLSWMQMEHERLSESA
jgi:predicted nucleotidyltransferase